MEGGSKTQWHRARHRCAGSCDGSCAVQYRLRILAKAKSDTFGHFSHCKALPDSHLQRRSSQRFLTASPTVKPAKQFRLHPCAGIPISHTYCKTCLVYLQELNSQTFPRPATGQRMQSCAAVTPSCRTGSQKAACKQSLSQQMLTWQRLCSWQIKQSQVSVLQATCCYCSLPAPIHIMWACFSSMLLQHMLLHVNERLLSRWTSMYLTQRVPKQPSCCGSTSSKQ